MNKIAQFEKVSFEQFVKDCNDTYNDNISEEELKNIWNNIKLPQRATIGSAGYDFYTPIGFSIESGETIKIPTGIRCKIDEGWVLTLFPRSSLGFKYRLQLDNTVGIIDSDYYKSDNEGHIFVKITNNSNEDKVITVKDGNGFIQGIFIPYGITINDNVNNIRNGGFGSTDLI